MNRRPLTSLIVYLTLLLASCIVSAQSVTVFTDRNAWESAAAMLRPGPFFMNQDFDSLTPRNLSSGLNDFWTDDPAGFVLVGHAVNSVTSSWLD